MKGDAASAVSVTALGGATGSPPAPASSDLRSEDEPASWGAAGERGSRGIGWGRWARLADWCGATRGKGSVCGGRRQNPGGGSPE